MSVEAIITALRERLEREPGDCRHPFRPTVVVESELDDAGGRELDLLLHRAGIEVVGFLPAQLDAARHAFEPLATDATPRA